MQRINVLVTAAGSGVGKAVIRSLQMHNDSEDNWRHYAILAVDPSPYAGGFFIGGGQTSRRVPLATESGYADCIATMCSEYHIDIIIPCSDPELPVLSGRKGLLHKSGAEYGGADFEVVYICRDKQATASFLKRSGFFYPKTERLHVRDGSFTGGIGWPMIVKPAQGSASRLASVLHTPQQAAKLIPTLPSATEFVLQEHVTEGGEFTTTLVLDDAGDVLQMVTFGRQPTVSVANAALARRWTCTPEPIEVDALKGIARALQKAGRCPVLNIQWGRAARGLVCFELNCRFPGSTILAAKAGVNLADTFCAYHVIGVHPWPRQQKALTFLRYVDEIAVPSDLFTEGA